MNNYILKELKIEVTTRCELACIHCSTDASPQADNQISLNKCLEIISEAAKMNVKTISFSGGEPLLHPNIYQIIEFASSYGIETSLYTTGNIDNIGDRFRDLKNTGLGSISLSLYSDNSVEHDYITRRSGSFIKSIDAIITALSLKIPIEIHFVALKRNFNKLSKVANYVSSIGVDKMSILRFVPQGRGTLLEDEILSKKDFLSLRTEIIKLRNEGFNIRTGSPLNFLFLNPVPKCNSAIDRLLIDTDLNIFPCDAFKRISAEEVSSENFNNNLINSTLYQCWHESTYLTAIRMYLESKFENPCSDCIELKRCKSGCLAQKIIEFGTLDKHSDPSCILK